MIDLPLIPEATLYPKVRPNLDYQPLAELYGLCSGNLQALLGACSEDTAEPLPETFYDEDRQPEPEFIHLFSREYVLDKSRYTGDEISFIFSQDSRMIAASVSIQIPVRKSVFSSSNPVYVLAAVYCPTNRPELRRGTTCVYQRNGELMNVVSIPRGSECSRPDRQRIKHSLPQIRQLQNLFPAALERIREYQKLTEQAS